MESPEAVANQIIEAQRESAELYDLAISFLIYGLNGGYMSEATIDFQRKASDVSWFARRRLAVLLNAKG